MPSCSGRGQVEPIAALAAVFAVGVGLSLYVGALEATLPLLSPEPGLADAAADRFVAEATAFGSVRPPVADPTEAASPAGHELNVTLRAEGRSWSGGQPVRNGADCVARRVSVTVSPGRVRPGRLEVCTWPAA